MNSDLDSIVAGGDGINAVWGSGGAVSSRR